MAVVFWRTCTRDGLGRTALKSIVIVQQLDCIVDVEEFVGSSLLTSLPHRRLVAVTFRKLAADSLSANSVVSASVRLPFVLSTSTGRTP